MKKPGSLFAYPGSLREGSLELPDDNHPPPESLISATLTGRGMGLRAFRMETTDARRHGRPDGTAVYALSKPENESVIFDCP
jgi:hypothetical protein